MHEIADRCRASGHSRVLLERDIHQEIQVFDRLKLAVEITRFTRGIMIAMVNKRPELDNDMRFAVTVANNRGGMYSLFDNVPEAEAWLLASNLIRPVKPDGLSIADDPHQDNIESVRHRTYKQDQ